MNAVTPGETGDLPHVCVCVWVCVLGADSRVCFLFFVYLKGPKWFGE